MVFPSIIFIDKISRNFIEVVRWVTFPLIANIGRFKGMLSFWRIYGKKVYFVFPSFNDSLLSLRILSSSYEKYEYGHLGHWYIKTSLYKRFLNWSKVWKKNKVVSGKTQFFVIGPFCTHNFICLNIGF